jgi:MFS family permease
MHPATTILVVTGVASLAVSIILPLLPFFANQMGAAGAELGFIFSAFAAARMTVSPCVGVLADRWGRRRLMLCGLFSYGLIALGFSIAGSVAEIIVGRLLMGAAAAMIIPLGRAYMGELAERDREGRMMSRFNMALFGGLALGPWLGGFIKDLIHVNAAFYAMSILGFAGFALSYWTLPKAGASNVSKPKSKNGYLTLLRDKRIGALFLFYFGTTFGLGASWTFLPVLSRHRLPLTSGRIGLLISVSVIMIAVTQPFFGPLADRMNRAAMIFIGGVCASLVISLLPLCHSFQAFFGVNILLGVSFGFYTPALTALSVEAGATTGFMNKVMSLMETAFSCGMVLGPLTAGIIMDAFGVVQVFQAGAFLGLFSSLLFLVLMSIRPPLTR